MKWLRSWWNNTSKTLDVVIILMLVVLLAVIVVSILGYEYDLNWSGLHGKTFWDWLQLLIIPAVLAVGGYLFNFATSRTEREIASDKQQEETLQAYIDSMSELLLEKNLRESQRNDEVQTIARVRTLTVLRRLDGKHKANVLNFLYESGLINKDNWIIDLSGANLRDAYLVETFLIGANLTGVDLSGANLFQAFLSEANLGFANMIYANLQKADLHGAFLFNTNLSGTNLKEALLNKADLRKANLSKANLSKAFLSGVKPNIPEADLSGANLEGVYLSEADVTDEQLAKAASLKGATLPDGTKHA